MAAAEPPPDSVHPQDREAWRAWLHAHHGRERGVWLVTWRKGSGRPVLAYDDAVEEALCFGWVDSRPRSLDAQRTMLWFAPRRAGSGWSAPNKARIERMIAAGRMTEAGLAKVASARADGSWTALDAIEALEIPDDLRAALDALAGAAAQFDGFPRSARRGILEWIASARRPETRARRVSETARLAQRGERANAWPPPRGGAS